MPKTSDTPLMVLLTTKIEEVIQMAEKLKVKKIRDGKILLNITTNTYIVDADGVKNKEFDNFMDAEETFYDLCFQKS